MALLPTQEKAVIAALQTSFPENYEKPQNEESGKYHRDNTQEVFD